MSRETATSLLERIVSDQRKIISDVTGKPASQTPQLWALYKEVQDYYEKGMRVTDDVTLLLCDDNWGNIRKLPKLDEKPRQGGYGIYYHFDYVGGPRNYKWLNTNPIPRIWEQMHLAWQYNARQIWIVNVGDIKPMEFPISFFLDYAWNPDKISEYDLASYTEQWAAAQFGSKYAKEIAGIIGTYGKYNARRKPELLDATTYTMNYNEWPNIVRDYDNLLKKAETINTLLPAAYKDAYFQLVLHPVKACANLNEMYYYAALNKTAYANNWEITNSYAERLALAAEKIAYGENIVYSGPIFQSATVEGNKISVSFLNTGSGLEANDGEALAEFAIAGADKKFVWAKASIEGDKVVVSSDEVLTPLYVRYAWADNPVNPNLFNKEGLPASPFRTDK